MTLLSQQKEKFAAILKCINTSCDQNGSIPHQVSEDEWEAEQCQYCFEIRFPAFKALDEIIEAATQAERARVRALVDGMVRDITQVSVAPAAKSKVRSIIESALDSESSGVGSKSFSMNEASDEMTPRMDASAQ